MSVGQTVCLRGRNTPVTDPTKVLYEEALVGGIVARQ